MHNLGYQYDNSTKNICGCVDSQKNPKKLYMSETGAKNAAEFSRLQNSVSLEIYECPRTKGWHLKKV